MSRLVSDGAPRKGAPRERAAARWTEEDARAVLEEADRSGETLRAFAESRSIDPQRLYWWRQRLARTSSSAPAFIPATVVPSRTLAARASSMFEVVVGHDCVIRVSPDFDAGELQRLVATLAGESVGC